MKLRSDEHFDETAFVDTFIRDVVAAYPSRRAASESERQAQAFVTKTARPLGVAQRVVPFDFSTNLYATMALHFGLGTLGTAVSGLLPGLGLGLHLLAGTSYWMDSNRKGYLLRRLQKWETSRNLLFTVPAQQTRAGEEPPLRIVFLAHIDAAFTGVIFRPGLVQGMSADKLPRPLRILAQPMKLVTYSQFALAVFDLIRIFLGPLAWVTRPLEWALSVPALLAFLLNLEVVIRNETVPGACDDLSGVAGLLVLMRRFAMAPLDNVELVFVVTGAEEAGAGGAYQLVRQQHEAWDPNSTVVIGLDGLCNGDLRFIHEGEITPKKVPLWLEAVLNSVCAADARFESVTGLQLPAGATDVFPFRQLGYDGVCLSCVDPELHAPRHYHLPTDTPEHLDPAQIVDCVDFAQKLVEAIVETRGLS